MRGRVQRRAKNVAMVMVGLRCAPETEPREKVRSVTRNQFVRPPTRGPIKEALSKGPNWEVGGAGMEEWDILIHIVT
jgi:hypothetical protein